MFHGSKRSGLRREGSPHKPRNKVENSILRPVPSDKADLFYRDYLESLDCPEGLTSWLLYKHGEHRQLVELSVKHDDYLSYRDFAPAYAAKKFFAKCQGLKTGIDTDFVALEKAYEAELICLETNHRIRGLRSGLLPDKGEGAIWYRAAQIILSILGPEPPTLFGRLEFEPSGPFSFLPCFDDRGWSKGRTTSSWGDKLAQVHKYSATPDVTPSARRYALQLLRNSPHWSQAVLNADGPCSILERGLNFVRGNVALVVLKDATSGRVINYEPTINIRLQLCVGGFIRQRLRSRAGIDLDTQKFNQRLALLSSLSGEDSTIDLRSASALNACELVRELLPCKWFELLDDLRSHYTTWPSGQVARNEGFSTMGNGFTFELESLIFYALSTSVAEHGKILVYGDDIVCNSLDYDSVTDALVKSGFIVNTKKSFKTGLFRESCGLHAMGGVLCTPVYLRTLIKRTEDVIKLHNRMYIQSWRSQKSRDRVDRLHLKWRTYYPHFIGPRFSPFGDLLSDGHYHTTLPPDALRATDGIDGWWFKTSTRIFPCSLFGDGRDRAIPERYFRGAILAALGPKANWHLDASLSDRRRWKYKNLRSLANFNWPEPWEGFLP